jgi:hypothetical protein
MVPFSRKWTGSIVAPGIAAWIGCASLSAPAAQPQAVETPLFGFVTVFGESVHVPGYEHDDYGPSPEVLAECISRSGATCVLVGTCGGTWRFSERSDPGDGPSQYDWKPVDASTDPFLLLNLLPISFFFLEGPAWIEDEFGSERWQKLADRFSEAFVRRANRKGIFHFIFENEPNMLARKDWPDYYMRKLKVFHEAAKRVNPRNMIIAGNLAERAAAAGHFDLLYDRGFSDYCDIVGHHPYNNDPSKGVDIKDAVRLRQVMVRRGDGDKQIFLGEGWGPKRNVPGVLRPHPGLVPTRKEIQTLAAFLRHGYRELTTPKDGWDPKWLFGAFFFTLNDNLGGRHWATRGKPLNGGVLIDGYFIPREALHPAFYNGGLLDVWGQPKADLVFRFPDGKLRPPPPRKPLKTRGKNLLPHGDFEREGEDHLPEGWKRVGKENESCWSRVAARGSGFSMSMGCEESDFDVGIVTAVPVKPGTEYLFSGWLLCENERRQNPDAFLTVGHDPTGQTAELIETISLVWSPDLRTAETIPGKWFRFERAFRATSSSLSLWIRCGNREGVSPFFIRTDDVELREVETEED